MNSIQSLLFDRIEKNVFALPTQNRYFRKNPQCVLGNIKKREIHSSVPLLSSQSILPEPAELRVGGMAPPYLYKRKRKQKYTNLPPMIFVPSSVPAVIELLLPA